MTLDIPRPLPLAREHVQGARLYANRVDALDALPAGGHVAEIGVAFGDFSAQLCARLAPAIFDAYDLYELHEIEIIWGQKSAERFLGRTHRKFYEDRFEEKIVEGRMRVFEGDGAANMAERPDEFYDMIYIDGNHSYEGVRRDAEVAVAKLKLQGYLVFNDYIMYDHTSHDTYGIVQVVNELCVSGGWRVHYLALQASMFCDVCLVRRG